MELLCEIRNRVGCITLNRPAALNALSHDMILQLTAKLRELATAQDIRAILIRGAGGKAFCAGGDIRSLYESFKASDSTCREFFVDEYRLDHYLHRYPKPYLALLDGITMGGGMGVGQAASMRVVTERTRMAMPEVGIGLCPDVGSSYFLSRLPDSLGVYLALTGTQIGASDILYTRLADAYLHSDSIGLLEKALSELQWSEDALGDIQRAVYALETAGLPASTFSTLRHAIEQHFSLPTIPLIIASLKDERRPKYTEWAQKTLAVLQTRSPLMLAVSQRQLRIGRGMDLADCFRMELGLVYHCFEQGDFIEGIRALIIDKDNAPRWNPVRIEDVTTEMVDAFFRNPWRGTHHPLEILSPDAR
jgi:enoyl-CoA hydratase/carnithine racemase